MKLVPGEKLSEIKLPSIQGSEFSIKKIKGKKTLLTFYRFATCPFCNLRIHEITKRYDELGKNFEMVAIFNSSQDYLTKKMGKHNAPFTILADQNFDFAKSYGTTTVRHNKTTKKIYWAQIFLPENVRERVLEHEKIIMENIVPEIV